MHAIVSRSARAPRVCLESLTSSGLQVEIYHDPELGYPPSMAWRWRSAAAEVLALAAAPGCSDRACLRLSGVATTCPGRAEALKQRTPACAGSVIAVTGDGE